MFGDSPVTSRTKQGTRARLFNTSGPTGWPSGSQTPQIHGSSLPRPKETRQELLPKGSVLPRLSLLR